MILHATSIAFGNRAILIRGAPGSGKSTLALELIETTGTGLGPTPIQAKLIADDQAILKVLGGRLMASAPETLRGKLEVRGLGIVDVSDVAACAELIMVVDLDPAAERLPPDGLTTEILGHQLLRLVFPPHAGGLASRVRTGFFRLKRAVAEDTGEA